MGETVASLTLKGVPDELLAQLKREAAQHRRSLNGEVLHRLESSVADAGEAATGAGRYRADLLDRPLTAGQRKELEAIAWVTRVREIRDQLGIHATTAEIIEARDFGRK